MASFHQVFERNDGVQVINNVDNSTLEDVTIDGSNIAEANEWEMLSVQEGTCVLLKDKQVWYGGEGIDWLTED